GWIVVGHLVELHLHADELAERVVVLLEPVGEDEAHRVVAGVVEDRLKERLPLVHTSHSRAGFSLRSICATGSGGQAKTPAVRVPANLRRVSMGFSGRVIRLWRKGAGKARGRRRTG